MDAAHALAALGRADRRRARRTASPRPACWPSTWRASRPGLLLHRRGLRLGAPRADRVRRSPRRSSCRSAGRWRSTRNGSSARRALGAEHARGPAWQLRRARGGLGLARAALRRRRPAAQAARRPPGARASRSTSAALQVGYATSGCWSPLLKKYIALAHLEAPLRRARARRWTMEVTVEHRRKRRAARDGATAAVLQPRAEASLRWPQTYDAIIIGGGHNGLVTAAYLGAAGRKVLVLERRDRVGGAAVTEEIFPGFKFSVFSYVVSLLRPEIIRDLDLPRHGLQILPLESTVTPLPNGDYLAGLGRPRQDPPRDLRHSPRDAEAYDEFGRLMHHMALAVQADPRHGPAGPDVARARATCWACSSSGRHFRGLGAEQFHALFKLMTMSAADFLDEWFETDVAQGHQVGERHHRHVPRAALAGHRLRAAAPLHGRDRRRRSAPGASPKAAPARSARRSPARPARFGAEIRTDAPVAQVLVKNGRAVGVVLENGDEIRARTRRLGPRPAPHLPQARGAEASCPTTSSTDIRRFKFRGSSGKVNLALERAARLHLPAGRRPAPARRDLHQPERGLPRARLRRRQVRRVLAQPVHGHHHPVDDRPAAWRRRAST